MSALREWQKCCPVISEAFLLFTVQICNTPPCFWMIVISNAFKAQLSVTYTNIAPKNEKVFQTLVYRVSTVNK